MTGAPPWPTRVARDRAQWHPDSSMHYVGGHDDAELRLPLKFPVELRKPEFFEQLEA